MATLEQEIRFWFEFYKLALNEPSLVSEIQKSAEKYAPWGDVRYADFEVWWPKHKELFGETRVEVVDQVGSHPSVLYVSIPLAQSTSRSIEQLRRVIADARVARIGQGYRLTDDAEIRHYVMRPVLLIYRDIYLPMNKPPLNAEFLAIVRNYFRVHPDNVNKIFKELGVDFYGFMKMREELRFNLKDQGVPTPFLTYPGGKAEDSALRTLRRYIQNAEGYMRAAAEYDFPGH